MGWYLYLGKIYAIILNMKEQYRDGSSELNSSQRQAGFFRRLAEKSFRAIIPAEVERPFVPQQWDPTPQFSDAPTVTPTSVESLLIEEPPVDTPHSAEPALLPAEASSVTSSSQAESRGPENLNRSVLVELDRQTSTIHFYDRSNGEKGEEVSKPVRFRPGVQAEEIFDRWAQIHQVVETDMHVNGIPHDREGLYAAKHIVELNQESSRPKLTATQIHAVRHGLPPMPRDVFRTPYLSRGNEFRFGTIALSSAYPREAEVPAVETKAEQPPPPRAPEKRAPSLEIGHPDLTVLDHAVLNVTWQGETRSYCLPMDSRQTMLLARTIESIALLRFDTERRQQRDVETGRPPVDSTIRASGNTIAQVAWARMSEMERQLFAHTKNNARVKHGAAFIEKELTQMLRKRTNMLRLTHERHSGHFTLLVPAENISLSYSEEPPTSEELDTYRKLPGAPMTIEPLDIPATEAEKLLDKARVYVDIVRSRANIADDLALDILDFVMMREGRWAIRQLSVNEKGKRSKIGVGTIHSYLRKRSGRTSMYEVGLENRLIGGTAVRKGNKSGNAGQIGGALPGKSNETIGKEEQAVRGYRINDKLANDEI